MVLCEVISAYLRPGETKITGESLRFLHDMYSYLAMLDNGHLVINTEDEHIYKFFHFLGYNVEWLDDEGPRQLIVIKK